MRERTEAAALVDRMVCGARIPGRAAREELRRELLTHFEEAGASAESIARFGDEADVAARLRFVHRWDYTIAYAAKTMAAVLASALVAVALELIVSVRSAPDAWRLAPGFPRMAALAVAVVLALATAREVAARPFNPARTMVLIGGYAACWYAAATAGAGGSFVTATLLTVLGSACARLTSSGWRWLLTIAAFGGVEYLLHLYAGVSLGPTRAAEAGAILAGVFGASGVIMTHADAVFIHRVHHGF